MTKCGKQGEDSGEIRCLLLLRLMVLVRTEIV